MTLFLLPNLLSEDANPTLSFPSGLSQLVDSLDGLIAEDAKAGRAFLKRHLSTRKVSDIPIAILNEHTQQHELDALLKPILQGQKWGVVSDAGLPCLADPGARLVAKARLAGLSLRAIPGPCSITHALILSGFSGQSFAFHGYLPREPQELTAALKQLEQRARKGETQVFIETPYRNDRLLQHLVQLSGDLLLCVACDLTSPQEEVRTQSIKDWKAKPLPALNDRPAVFLLSK